MDLKIIPKSYVPHLEMEVSSAEPPVILIDDNSLLLDVWKLHCDFKGITLHTFDRLNDAVLEAIEALPRDAVIYIDSSLGPDIKGEEESKKLYDMGFRTIYLLTGFDKADFSGHYPWLTDIIRKDCPL